MPLPVVPPPLSCVINKSFELALFVNLELYKGELFLTGRPLRTIASHTELETSSLNLVSIPLSSSNLDSVTELSAFGEKVEGSVKVALGSITGNRSLEREDEMQAASGSVYQGQNRVLTGMFRNRDSAERVYNSAISRGYSKDEVNLMMSDQTRDTYFADGDDSAMDGKALESAGTGSAIGGTFGAIIAGVAAIGTSIVIPGLGLIVAGPLAAALAGAGGLTGGLVGALIGVGNS